jgi:hypothetical protein
MVELAWEYPPQVVCIIRPIFDIGTRVPDMMPHCCIWQHNLHDTVNFDMLTGWLKRCDGEHDHSLTLFAPGRELTDFRVIDVRHRCIVKRSRDVRYAALSYTWGSQVQYCLTKQNKGLLQEIDGLSRHDVTLGATVKDAMQVCSNLNIPYLWIDSICIVQDDEAGKHNQIQNMDLVYANAYITLVVASGQGTDLGLPRVSVPVGMDRATLSVNGVTYSYSKLKLDALNHTSSPLNMLFTESHWFTRGWCVLSVLIAEM